MGCNCGKNNKPQITRLTAPSIPNGTNQILLKQIAEQARQQQAIQQIIHPFKTVIKTYR